MTKRFKLAYEKGNWWAVRDGDITLWKEEVISLLNVLHEENQKLLTLSNMKKGALVEAVKDLTKENEQLKYRIEELRKELSNCEEDYNMQDMEIKALRKELHLVHMSSMFSTVKSFKGDISKRYKYSEKTDMIYDTANHYGESNKVLGKKEVTMLLNEYNTLLEESNEE